MEGKAFCLIISPPLIDCLQLLKHYCNVASLSVFYRYINGYCSYELANCMPPPTSCGLAAQDFLLPLIPVHLNNARVTQHIHSFIPFTGKLWNSLPDSVFTPTYDLNSLKRGVKFYSVLLYILRLIKKPTAITGLDLHWKPIVQFWSTHLKSCEIHMSSWFI